MSDLNREFERAVTGRSGEGLSLMGWVVIVLGGLFVLGAVGAGFAAFFIRDHVREIRREMATGFEGERVAATAEAMLSRLESQTRLLQLSPDQGLDFLADAPVEALARNLADFGQEPGGGSLTLRSDQGEVRLDLVRTERGGSLTIDSPDGQVRMDLVRGENGGELVIRSEEGTVRFGAGEGAAGLPGWVPRLAGMPSQPEGVYSLTSPDGSMGAVSWESDRSAMEVLDAYKEALQGQGYDLKVRVRMQATDPDREQANLWAREDGSGRLVFVAAERTGGVTKVLLGYGEEVR